VRLLALGNEGGDSVSPDQALASTPAYGLCGNPVVSKRDALVRPAGRWQHPPPYLTWELVGSCGGCWGIGLLSLAEPLLVCGC
jgi:hypothetical protein